MARPSAAPRAVLSPAFIALFLACGNSIGLPVLKLFWNCKIRTGTDLDGFVALTYLFWPILSLAIGVLTLFIALWDVVNGRTLLRAILALVAIGISFGVVVVSLSPGSYAGDRQGLYSDCQR